MNTTTLRTPRPLAVNLALFVMLMSCGVSLAPSLIRADWSDLFVWIKYGAEFIILFLPLWFIFRGKNWARWLLVAFVYGGFCLSLPQLIQHFESRSFSWIASYCLRNAIVVGALIALFLPISTRWFLRDKNEVPA